MGRPLKIAKAQAVVTITATAAATDVVTTNANFANLGIIAGMPFVTAGNVGGLVAGTTYWILEVLNDGANSTFTVSETDLSANPDREKVDLSATSAQTVAATVGLVDSGFNNGSGYGIVGGNTSLYGNQVVVRCAIGLAGTGTITCATDSANLIGVGTDFANDFSDGTVVTTAAGVLIGYLDDPANNASNTFAVLTANAAVDADGVSYVYADNEPGFIVRQKGKTKYLVTGANTALTSACYSANVANAALLPNTFNVIATYANTTTAFGENLSDHNGQLFGNVPVYVTFGSAEVANVDAGIYYPVVTINKA